MNEGVAALTWIPLRFIQATGSTAAGYLHSLSGVGASADALPHPGAAGRWSGRTALPISGAWQPERDAACRGSRPETSTWCPLVTLPPADSDAAGQLYGRMGVEAIAGKQV